MMFSFKQNYHRLFSILFICFILLMPTALLFKIRLGALDFSLSYVMLLSLLGIITIDIIMRYKTIYKNKIFFILIMYLFSTIVSFVFTGFNFTLIFPLLIFVLFFIFGYLNYDYILGSFATQIIFLSFVLSVLGIILYYINIPLIDFKNAGNDGYFSLGNGHFRAVSVFMNPNNFGYFLIFVIPFQFFRLNSKWNNIVLLINLYALHVTYSRSAVFVVMIVILLPILKRIKYSKKIILYMSIPLLVITCFLMILFQQKLSFYDIRFVKWGIGISYIIDGIQNFFYGVSKITPILKNGISFSDNWYIYIWLHSGIFSLLIWLYFQLTVMRKAITIFYVSTDKRVLSISLYSVVVFVPFVLSNYIQFFPAAFFTALSFGVISAYPKNLDKGKLIYV